MHPPLPHPVAVTNKFQGWTVSMSEPVRLQIWLANKHHMSEVSCSVSALNHSKHTKQTALTGSWLTTLVDCYQTFKFVHTIAVKHSIPPSPFLTQVLGCIWFICFKGIIHNSLHPQEIQTRGSRTNSTFIPDSFPPGNINQTYEYAIVSSKILLGLGQWQISVPTRIFWFILYKNLFVRIFINCELVPNSSVPDHLDDHILTMHIQFWIGYPIQT